MNPGIKRYLYYDDFGLEIEYDDGSRLAITQDGDIRIRFAPGETLIVRNLRELVQTLHPYKGEYSYE